MNSVKEKDEMSAVNQFFHIMGSVNQVKGCALTDDGSEYTVYTSCMNADKGIYYFNTYENRQLNAVDMNSIDTDGNELIIF